MSIAPVFHRAIYARDTAQQLLRPTALQVQVRSGVFLAAYGALARPPSCARI